MKIGLLWEFNSKKKKEIYNLKKEILKAAEYYNIKYGYQPDTCFVNPITKDIEDIEFEGNKIKVLKDKCIPPLQIWIGNENDRILKEKETHD